MSVVTMVGSGSIVICITNKPVDPVEVLYRG